MVKYKLLINIATVFLNFVQMYVPGKLADSNNFIVDIGTGYFVEKASIIIYYTSFKRTRNSQTT